MVDAWADFRTPEATAGNLVRNDATIVPNRAPVTSSSRVWGDKEAQDAGLYGDEDPWAAFRQKSKVADAAQATPGIPQITVRPSTAVSERFAETDRPENAAALERGLNQRTLEMTRGKELPPVSRMAVEQGNILSAASQGTSPHVDQYGGRIVSTEVHEDDGGNLLYRDTQTGQLVPTDNTKHVALRDPVDNRIKVFERSDTTNENAGVGIARTLAPGLASGAVTARPSIADVSKVIPRSQDVLATSKPMYEAFDAASAKQAPILADEAKVMVDRIQNALDTAHLPSEVAKQVHDTVALLGKKGDTALNQLQYVKRAVGNLFKSPDPNVRGGASVASKEIMQMISELNKEAATALQTGDKIQAAGKSLQKLERRADIANLRTSRAGYGGNAVNNARSQVEKIVEDAVNGKTTGFTKEEIQAMREIVNGNGWTNSLRMVGQLSPSKGSIATLGGIPTLGMSWLVGAAANKLATILTGKQLERLNELVAKRSPAYRKAVERAVERFEKAQVEFANNPAPNRLAGYVSASRALASGLAHDGVHLSSGDLLRSIQGPMKSAAEGDEPPVPRGPGE